MDIDSVTALLPAPGVAWQPGDAFLAGGTWLFSQEQPGLNRLLDLHAFGWEPLTVTPEGDLEIAATCTLAELAGFEPPTSWAAWRVVEPCVDTLLGSFKVQAVATVGGNLCLALPAAPMAVLGAGLDGTCTVWPPPAAQPAPPAPPGPRSRPRTLRVVDLLTGDGRTSLAPGELLRSVRLPAAALRSPSVFRRASLSVHGRSAAAVLARRAPGGAVTVVVTAAIPRPVELTFDAPPAPGRAVEVLERRLGELGLPWLDDVHGLAPWRAAMTRRLVAQALTDLEELP